MKQNGFKIFATLAFVLMCGYSLFPSFRSMLIENRLDSMTEEEQRAYLEENKATVDRVNEKSMKLGLDLLGGMHVTLEVRLDALIRELATDPDEAFEAVLTAARERTVSGNVSMIDEFARAFQDRDPNARLSRYFRDDDAGIRRESTNEDVIIYLQTEADEAVLRAIEIIRQRVDRYGVTEPSIQRQGSRRIVVELPGVEDQERVRNLLRGTARLEFHLMGDPQDVVRLIQQSIEFYELGTAAGDSTGALAAADSAVAVADTTSDLASLLGEEEEGPTNPLLALMTPLGQGSVRFGEVSEADTMELNALIRSADFQRMLPLNTSLMYTSAPEGIDQQGFELYHLLMVRNEIELDGGVVTDASVDFDLTTNAPEVSMTMNSEGARVWSRLTGANVGRQVAVVLDNVVYSFPVINERIPSGRTQISGLDSPEEAEDIVTVLKSGALPAPVTIVEERTVGPSLGAASIQSGLRSIISGLVLVALFMIMYYRTAGMVADLALLINIIFILGILAGFQATLTLPGIAGIVLTIGMAVDANVLIFERVREEQGTGKTLKASIEGGYAKALSAIFDANITTFFVGLILYSFGVGPIKGFAVTLMAGILASLFSAIVITRIVFDWMVIQRRGTVNYG